MYFRDDSGHNGWANSRALELVGVNRDSEDPAGGKIVRDPKTGEPNGLLLEEAKTLVEHRVPDWTEEQYQAGVLEMVRIAKCFTSFNTTGCWRFTIFFKIVANPGLVHSSC